MLCRLCGQTKLTAGQSPVKLGTHFSYNKYVYHSCTYVVHTMVGTHITQLCYMCILTLLGRHMCNYHLHQINYIAICLFFPKIHLTQYLHQVWHTGKCTLALLVTSMAYWQVYTCITCDKYVILTSVHLHYLWQVWHTGKWTLALLWQVRPTTKCLRLHYFDKFGLLPSVRLHYFDKYGLLPSVYACITCDKF